MKRQTLSANFNNDRDISSNDGFTLIELLISLVLFMVVTGSIFGLMQVARRVRSEAVENTSLNKTVRLALNLLGRDAYNAGYGYPLKNTVVSPDNRISTLLGIPNDIDTTRDTVPPIIAGNNITLNTFNSTANVKTDQVTFLYKDSSFNVIDGVSTPISINAATTPSTGIDQIVPVSGGNSGCKVNDLYLITGNTGATLGLVTALSGSDNIQFADGDLLHLNLTGSTGPLRSITVPANIMKVRMVTYFVTADGTLTRREYGNVLPAVAYVDEPLVFDVEDFQVKYVMDNGTINDNPLAGPDGVAGTADDTPSNLAAVRQVTFTVKAKSGDKDPTGKPFEVSMTSTFSTRNLGYDAN